MLQSVAVPEKKNSEVNRACEKSPWDLVRVGTKEADMGGLTGISPAKGAHSLGMSAFEPLTQSA